jgi:hypothetical protein
MVGEGGKRWLDRDDVIVCDGWQTGGGGGGVNGWRPQISLMKTTGIIKG